MSTITDGELEKCYRTIACIVRDRGDKYLPVFQRIHQEVENRKGQRELKDIALQTANLLLS